MTMVAFGTSPSITPQANDGVGPDFWNFGAIPFQSSGNGEASNASSYIGLGIAYIVQGPGNCTGTILLHNSSFAWAGGTVVRNLHAPFVFGQPASPPFPGTNSLPPPADYTSSPNAPNFYNAGTLAGNTMVIEQVFGNINFPNLPVDGTTKIASNGVVNGGELAVSTYVAPFPSNPSTLMPNWQNAYFTPNGTLWFTQFSTWRILPNATISPIRHRAQVL